MKLKSIEGPVKPEKEPSLGESLKTLRKEKGMSLGELEKASGVGKGYLCELEKEAKGNPSIDVLQKIARGLEVPVSELIREPKPDLMPTGTLPPGLKEFLESAERSGMPVRPAEVEWLRLVRYRGRQPSTAEDWALLYDLVKRISVK